MSGAKRITVDEGAWRQANAAAARLRQVRRDMPAMLDAVRREQRAEIDRALGAAEGRQRRVEEALSGLSEQTRKSEQETARRLREQAARLRTAAGTLRAENRRALAEHEERTRASIAEERRERRAQIQELGRDLAALRGDRDRAAAVAAQVLADARLLGDAIRAELPHERFAPGRLERLERRLATADANQEGGLGAESLSLIQETFLDLAELRADLVLLDQEWQAARLAALDALTVVAERVRFSAELPVPDMTDAAAVAGDAAAAADAASGTADGRSFDVDHWSDGALSRLGADVEARAGLVRADEGAPTTEELREIVRTEAPALEGRFDEIVTRAAAALLASQARVNVAEQVVDAVEHATGFAWAENAYAGDDQRAAFFSRLRHLNDNEIVIEVAHEDGGDDRPGELVVRILSYDRDTVSEEELADRAGEIATGLRQRGLPVGDPVEDGRRGDQEQPGFEALRRRATRARPAPDAK